MRGTSKGIDRRFRRLARHLASSVADDERYLLLLDRYREHRPFGRRVSARLSRQGTALHRAVARGEVDKAVELLSSGADTDRPSNRGQRALDPEFVTPELLHSIRLQYQNRRTRRPGGARPSPDAVRLASELESHGVVKLTGAVSSAELASLRSEFADFIESVDRRVAVEGATHPSERRWFEEGYFDDERFYTTNNAFKWSPTLLDLVTSPRILDPVRLYLGERFFLQRAEAMRYDYAEESTSAQFSYHHDLEGRRVKLQLLLTDVTERGHAMSYVAGSHTIDHPFHRYRLNQLSLPYVERRMQRPANIVDAVGRAGDVWLFDSNGAHRANLRSGGPTRDVYFAEYNSDTSNVYGGTVDPKFLDSASPEARRVLEAFTSVEPRWTRPREDIGPGPTWRQTLWQVDDWLGRSSTTGA